MTCLKLEERCPEFELFRKELDRLLYEEGKERKRKIVKEMHKLRGVHENVGEHFRTYIEEDLKEDVSAVFTCILENRSQYFSDS